ncbi:MAG: hypothetical protein CMC15_07320 [Flavobacteriaceae bacterium]|nr:hypothetical protein [Flavobacteriaceae bacterium]MAY53189.1 hypothetical protein [Flavobacteriaceae bacterium]
MSVRARLRTLFIFENSNKVSTALNPTSDFQQNLLFNKNTNLPFGLQSYFEYFAEKLALWTP